MLSIPGRLPVALGPQAVEILKGWIRAARPRRFALSSSPTTTAPGSGPGSPRGDALRRRSSGGPPPPRASPGGRRSAPCTGSGRTTAAGSSWAPPGGRPRCRRRSPDAGPVDVPSARQAARPAGPRSPGRPSRSSSRTASSSSAARTKDAPTPARAEIIEALLEALPRGADQAGDGRGSSAGVGGPRLRRLREGRGLACGDPAPPPGRPGQDGRALPGRFIQELIYVQLYVPTLGCTQLQHYAISIIAHRRPAYCLKSLRGSHEALSKNSSTGRPKKRTPEGCAFGGHPRTPLTHQTPSIGDERVRLTVRFNVVAPGRRCQSIGPGSDPLMSTYFASRFARSARRRCGIETRIHLEWPFPDGPDSLRGPETACNRPIRRCRLFRRISP